MARLAEAYVDIGANLRPMQAGLGRTKSMLTSFAAKAFTVSLGAATGGAGIAGGLLAAAKKAADLGESISKVKVTFGSASKEMIDQADELAHKYGVVEQTTLDAASGFGLMGRAAGLSAEASGKLGQELVQLGLDMASFHNLSNEDAFEKLRSGLAGEAEPLRPLGILLSEDAVKAQALAMGLTKVKRELTDQEKIVARLALIRKQAGPAVGDLERTADSNANQLRKLQGELENAAVDFGGKLQGALQDGISLAHELGAAIKSATGMSFSENVASWVRAGINAARTGKLLPSVEQSAVAAGLPLAAAGNGWGAGNNGFGRARQNHLVEADLARRQHGEELRADLQDRNDRIKEDKLKNDAKAGLSGLVRGLGAELGAALAGKPAPILGAAGRLIQGGARLAQAGAQAARNHIEQGPFQSQSFSSGGDYARFAIEQALSSPEDAQKKQAEALEQARDKLNEIKDLGQAFLDAVHKAPALRYPARLLMSTVLPVPYAHTTRLLLEGDRRARPLLPCRVPDRLLCRCRHHRQRDARQAHRDGLLDHLDQSAPASPQPEPLLRIRRRRRGPGRPGPER